MTGQVSDYHHDYKHNIYVCSQNINGYILPFLKYANSSNNYLYTKKNKTNGPLIRIWWQIIKNAFTTFSRVSNNKTDKYRETRSFFNIYQTHILLKHCEI